MVKWRFKCQLRLVWQRLPAIPARCAKSAGRIHEALKELRDGLIGRSSERRIIHDIRIGVVELGIYLDT
jgi:hypothetical protein